MRLSLALLALVGYALAGVYQVNDYLDVEYIGNITIGTPEQEFRYCFGTVSGVVGIDRVRFGSPRTDQLVIPRCKFGQAEKLPPSFARQPFDGILGLGFYSFSPIGTIPPFIEAMLQGLVSPMFTVFMKQDEQADGDGGVITYGAVDKTNCGRDITWEPLSSSTSWQFTLSGVKSGGFSQHMHWQAISATATSRIGAPSAVVHKIVTEAGAEYDKAKDVYFIRCNSSLTIELDIGKRTYTIETKNLIAPADGDRCILALFDLESNGFGPSWILGTPFIRQYCHTYDVESKKIGFARSLQK
ncbi:eukaryotic aspartyl protease [Teladorsagia circumcincta]|uniref:Eukaryotic aspartyl protease n=1 Tax=Teladorsagia circumcincta TaxID=45464 RepID=A0A2G9UW90_TELCI|nr:eukaryotic aspartyl protease [Teladorsagia circumcincta]